MMLRSTCTQTDPVSVLHGLPVGVLIEEIVIRIADVEVTILLLSLNHGPVSSSFLMHACSVKHTCYWDNDVAARHVPLSAMMRCQAYLRRSTCSPPETLLKLDRRLSYWCGMKYIKVSCTASHIIPAYIQPSTDTAKHQSCLHCS
jgi:hypothetical protein